MATVTAARKTPSPRIRNDWVSKSLAGAILGLALGLAASGILNHWAMAIPFSTRLQLAMWIVPPVWMGVLGGVFFFRSGLRAWAWLGLATLVSYATMFAIRYLGAGSS